MNFNEAVASLHKGSISKFTLMGSEDFFKDMFVREAAGLGREMLFFHPGSEDDVLGSLQSGDLFGEGKVMVLHDVNTMKRFGDIIHVLPGCTDVVICVSGDKATAKAKAMTELISVTERVPCNKLREYGTDYPLFIKFMASGNGYTMRDGSEDMLYSVVGPDLYRLHAELRKLMHVKEPGDITPDDVKTYVFSTAEAGFFDIFDRMMRKDVPGTLSLYETHPKTPQQQHELMKMSASYFEKLYRILLLKEQNFDSDDIADIVGIPRFLLRTKYLSRAMALGKSYISDRLSKLCEAEAGMRTFKGDKNILMYRFIYQLS